MANNIDIILCDIIGKELDLTQDRVVISKENYDPPKDELIYIIVSLRNSAVLSSTNKFDDTKNEEVKTVVCFDYFDIDITSLNRDAMERKEEVIMALTSVYSERKQLENSIKIFRIGKMQDLSFIESASALKRFRVPIVVSNLKEKRTKIDVFDKFKSNQEDINE